MPFCKHLHPSDCQVFSMLHMYVITAGPEKGRYGERRNKSCFCQGEKVDESGFLTCNDMSRF